MKIVYGITKGGFGGAGRYVFDLAAAAKEAGHEVAVLCGGQGLLVDKLSSAGIRVISIPSMKRDVDLLTEIPVGIGVMKVLYKEKPDVFHINSSKMGGTGAFAGRLMGVPKIIFTAHGWPFWEPRGNVAKALIYFFSWLTAILAHKVIVISNYDLNVAKKMLFVKDKVVRIYNGIDLQTKFEDGHVIRQAFPANAKITGTIGELNNNKNQIALVEEASKNPDMFVAIVGEGEKQKFLEAKIKEYKLESRVKLFGFLPMEQVMKGFDTFALPSLKEGLPYVLLEAKLAGLPIKANPIGGVSEILEQDIQNFSLEKMISETLKIY